MPTTDWHDVVLHEVPSLEDIGPFPPQEIFFGGPRSEGAFGGRAGVVQGPSFTAAEVERIRELIKQHLVGHAHQVCPRAASAIADVPLDQYHRVVEEHDHRRLLSKLGRVLPAGAVDEIRQMSFFDYVRDAFGPYYLSDEESLGHEQICFRVVRPNCRGDVGSLHRDSWFWDYFHFPVPAGVARVKAWVPVCGTQDRAALLLAPGSHRHPAGFRTETVDGKLAFLPEVNAQAVDLRWFRGNPGDPVMFNYNVLHVGALTQGENSRVSFEITIMFNSEQA
jgi:hypothetical protein